MNKNSRLALLAVAGTISGCSTTQEGGSDKQLLEIPLTATSQNAGEIAKATLTPQGEETAITFFIGGVPPYTTRPVRLYTFIYSGSCAALGANPAFEMNQTVTTSSMTGKGGGMTLSKKAPVALDVLRSKGYALVVRAAPQDGSYDIFCGNIS